MISEFLDTNPNLDVQEKEYKRLLGYPNDYILEGRAKELTDWAQAWYKEHGTPWIYARQVENVKVTDGRIRIDETEFTSPHLYQQLVDANAHNVMLVAVGAGKSCEEKARELWREEKPDEYFFLEVYGSAVVEHLIAGAGFRFCEWGDRNAMAVLPHYSPGYPGWEITDQHKLLNAILQNKRIDFPEEIQVMETGMLRPKKSLIAVFGITSHTENVQRLTSLIPCQNCSLTPCQYRRVPYKYSLPQIENVQGLQFRVNENVKADIKKSSALTSDAKYSVSSKALQKWTRERLHLKILSDTSVEARFRYEGTTCSNMGRALEFDYHVKLSSSDAGYKILETNCFPAPGDTGHTYMCQYVENPGTLMTAIENEKPLLGKPLNDLLTWQREYNPSACYCRAVSREYKWGLVFEVLHYALVQYENQKTILPQSHEGTKENEVF